MYRLFLIFFKQLEDENSKLFEENQKLKVTYFAHMDTLRHTTKACEKHRRGKRHLRERIDQLIGLCEQNQIDWRKALGIVDKRPKSDTAENTG